MDMPLYDAAKAAAPPLFHPDGCYCLICGPGGNSTLTENNEKGILQTRIHEVMDTITRPELSAHNDQYRQGIYTTNSMGDND